MANSSWFDQSYYLSAKAAYNNANAIGGLTTWTSASVQASLAAAGMTPEQHYTQYGWTEALAPNAYYVESEYVTSKVAQLNAGAVGGRTNWTNADFYASLNGTNPFMHYVQYGAYEAGVEPSTGFNDDTYYADKAAYNNAHAVGGITTWTAATVEAAFQSAGLTPIGHYELYGQAEGFYTPTPTPTPGQTYRLTTGADTFTGGAGDDTFDGSVSPQTGAVTFQSYDKLTGGGGNDILIAQGIGSVATQTTTLSGIENIQLYGVVAGTLNLTNTTGVTSISNSGATAGYVVSGIAAGIQNLAVTANTGNQQFTVQNAAVVGATDSIALAVDTAGSKITIDPTSGNNGYETINITASGGASTFTIDDGTSTSLKTLNFNNTSANTLTVTDGTTGTATLYDASASTGAVNITAATTGAITMKGGSGNDILNDSLGYTTADTIDGGTGTNRLVLTRAQAAGVTTTQSNVSNINVIAVNDTTATASTFNVANFGATGFRYDAAAGAADTINFAAGANTVDFQSNGSANQVTVNGSVSGTSDQVNVTLGNATAGTTSGQSGALIFNNVETVVLNSVGAANTALTTVTMSPATGTKLNITGDQAIGMTATTAGTIDASGMTGAATFSNTSSTVSTTITGTSNADSIVGSTAADVLNGGAGADTIANTANIANTGTAGDVMTGGAGQDNFIIRGTVAGTATNYSGVAYVTDFTQTSDTTTTDKLDLSVTSAAYGASKLVQAGGGALTATATPVVQALTQNTVAAAGASAGIYVMATGVAFNTDAQTTFNNAIGAGSITGAGGAAGDDVFVTYYDTTNSRMVTGVVDLGANSNLDSGDTFTLVGTASMSAADYAALSTKQFKLIA